LNGRICEFYEILGTQRDYLGVRLVAMVWKKLPKKSQINFWFFNFKKIKMYYFFNIWYKNDIEYK
jgi:hypothetical protein